MNSVNTHSCLSDIIRGIEGLRPLNRNEANIALGSDARIHIFVNGILNDLISTIQSAGILRRTRNLPARCMTVFHVPDHPPQVDLSSVNARSVSTAIVTGLGAALTNVSRFLHSMNPTTIDALAGVIKRLTVDSQREIELHAHSRGALAVALALESLEETPHWDEIREGLHIRTYGGVRLIAPSMARNVQNYVNPNDVIVFGGRFSVWYQEPIPKAKPSIAISVWLGMIQNTTDDSAIRRLLLQMSTMYEADLGETSAIVRSLKVRSWIRRDTHSFNEYMRHLEPTEQDETLENRVHGAGTSVAFAQTIVAFLLMLHALQEQLPSDSDDD